MLVKNVFIKNLTGSIFFFFFFLILRRFFKTYLHFILYYQKLASELKAKLEKAREARKNVTQKTVVDNREESIILTKTDSRGRVFRAF